MSSSDKVIDYAVIGGGVAGAYSAWRLRQARPDARVALFEYSDRIGGKLLSRTLPGMPNVVAELGGMRYIPKEQKLVKGLVKELCLAKQRFPMGSKKTGDSRNLCFFRSTHLFNGELDETAKVPYRVDWIESDKSPNDLMNYVVGMLVPGYENLAFDDWFRVKVFGKYLYEYGFWNLLYRVLSPEAYAFMRDGLGYDTNVANGNAINMLVTAGDTAGTAKYYTLTAGYEALPIALAEQYKQSFDGEEHRNCRLASMRRGADGLYDLNFVTTETTDHKTRDRDQAEHMQHKAKHVILAMPRRSIELIDWPAKDTDAWLRENLGSVLIQRAFKLFLGYDTPWWRGLGLKAGRSITDMPIRQTYYFGTEGDQPGADPANRNSLLMASYNDISTVPFWKGLQNGPAFTGRTNAFVAKGEKPVPAAEFVASEQMIAEAHRQVTLLHGQTELPLPYSAIYHDWSEDPYGGGWHSWKAGYRYNEIMPRMRHPVADENVYICGAAYSADQGWVEGALETAEQMLREDLGIEAHECVKGWNHDPLKKLKTRLRER